jgi:hypothetical protein
MMRKALRARLMIPVIVAASLGPLRADEPAGTPPPATSIREWKSPTAVPTAGAGQPAAPTGPATSIREWRSTTSAAPTGNCPTTAAATPATAATASPAAKTAVTAAGPKIPITISIKSTLREGNLVVLLDDVPIFNEAFRKPVLLISQTTTWDPLQVATGDHRLSAKVYGSKKTYFSKVYDLHLGRTGNSALRFVMQGDHLSVDLGS